MFLPPYSPDFNPIELAFAKLKALLRKAAARTVHALEAAIASALDAFLPDECANYFTNSGYEPDSIRKCPSRWTGSKLCAGGRGWDANEELYVKGSRPKWPELCGVAREGGVEAIHR